MDSAEILLLGILVIVGSYLVGMHIRDMQGVKLVYVSDYKDLDGGKYICSFKDERENTTTFFSFNKKICDRLRKGGPVSIIVSNETMRNGVSVADVIEIRGITVK